MYVSLTTRGSFALEGSIILLQNDWVVYYHGIDR